MALSVRSIRCLSRVLLRHSAFKDHRKCSTTSCMSNSALLYSTAISNQIFDVFEIFTDVLNFNRTRENTIKNHVIPRYVEKETGIHQIDGVLKNIDVLNVKVSTETLTYELGMYAQVEDWTAVGRIIRFCVHFEVPVGRLLILDLAENFCRVGFVDGLRSLLLLCDVSKPEDCLLRGKLLHFLAKCYWITSNAQECILALQECYEKHPNLLNTTKQLLRMMIYQAVSSRSEAELVNVVDFVQRFTDKCSDYYPLAVLWNYLFVSEWFTDNKLADELLENNKNLRICVSLMSTSLTGYLIKNREVNDVYRLLHILLKFQMMETYSAVTQILFDYYCIRGNRSACSEIVKSSVTLKAPLRDEQYDQFISWSVSGNPFKFLSQTQIERIYSKF